MTNTADRFHFFWGGPFSQWQKSAFDLDGKTFNTAEQAMMYSKALLFDDPETAGKIATASDPGRQKALGRQVRNFEETVWQARREEIVYRVNHAKFSQNKGLRRKLFQTGDKLLVEASPNDLIWGIGLDAQKAARTAPEDWPGQNLLGRILTDVRNQLRLEHPDEVTQTEL